MTSNHFLVKQKNLHPPQALLDEEEHHHLSRVLRMGPGEKVCLVDKQGNSCRAEVEEVGRRQTRLSQPYSSSLKARDEARRLILCEDGRVFLRDILAVEPAQPGHLEVPAVVVLVGPEGGWTKKEEEQAVEKGFEAVSLGSRILRSETAAPAILAAISVFWGD